MDSDDFMNNRIDPALVLETSERSKQKGFKQKNCWSDQREAVDRYLAHLKNSCQPLMKHSIADGSDEAVDCKKFYWEAACTDLARQYL